MSDTKSQRRDFILEFDDVDESEYKEILNYLQIKNLPDSEIGTESIKLFKMHRMSECLEIILNQSLKIM